MKDSVLVAGWLWAAYLALRLLLEAVRRSATSPAPAKIAADDAGHHPKRNWSPVPAVLWLAAEGAVAAIVVAAAWLVLRDASLNLVPASVSAAPVDVRRVAVAAILGWSLLVVNVWVGWRLVGRLLPTDSKKSEGGVDPERMGATIGVLERLLVVVLVPAGGPAAVGFIVAAKTLARFKELNKKRFAERYLLGTMASVTVALVSAMVAQWVWTSQF
jgi:hypothetical protein